MCFKEEWRPVVGYEDFYEVSSFGNVRSKDRVTIRENGRPLPIKGRKIKFSRCGHVGYFSFDLCDGKTSTKKHVHTLVLEAFFGPRKDGQQARHLDGDPLNNSVHNLSWGTQHENMQDRRDHGGILTGERGPLAKLTNEKVLAIRKLYEKTEATQEDLANLFDISRPTISSIITRRTWKYV